MKPLVTPERWHLPSEQDTNGCFETMRAYQAKIFRLEPHLDRLYGSAAFLGTRMPRTRAWLRGQLLASLKKTGIQEAIVRVALMQGEGRPAKPMIVVRHVEPPAAEAFARGIRVAAVPAHSFPVSNVDPQAKYSARLGSVLAVQDAQVRGADEAIFTDVRGYVTESTASNFAIVKDGVLFTPPCEQGLLWGITRSVLFEIAQRLGIPARDGFLTRHDLYNADEMVMTSTIKEVLPVAAVDGRKIGGGKPGPFARRLLAAFRELVREELVLKGPVTSWGEAA